MKRKFLTPTCDHCGITFSSLLNAYGLVHQCKDGKFRHANEDLSKEPTEQDDPIEIDTDNTRKFSTGAVRDVAHDKPNFPECLSFIALWKYGEYMKQASAKYGEGNWQKGIPAEEYEKSLMRHIVRYFANKQGAQLEPEVDHLQASLFNLLGLIHELTKKEKCVKIK